MSYRKLGRNSAARKALFTSILTSFFRYGRIETTEAKAKELRKFAENLITLAKRGDLSARRQAIAQLADEDVVRKLFDEIASKYADRQGGYTRILKLGVRRGDAAPMVIIELAKRPEFEGKNIVALLQSLQRALPEHTRKYRRLAVWRVFFVYRKPLVRPGVR